MVADHNTQSPGRSTIQDLGSIRGDRGPLPVVLRSNMFVGAVGNVAIRVMVRV